VLKFSKLFLIAVVAAASAHAADNVNFTGAFESADTQESGSTPDGFFLQTLPHPQAGVGYVGVGDGGAGPGSGLDTRVVPNDQVGSEIVLPRKGRYFLRSAIYFNKDYSRFPGANGNKSRSTIGMPSESLKFDYDEEGYVGFSIYTPRNYEPETGILGDRGSVVLLETNASTDSTLFTVSQFVSSADNQAHWWIKYYLDDLSTTEENSQTIVVDLGTVAPDTGKWTDFVIRYRANPFSARTNPSQSGIANSMDLTYEGNKGILQLWKSEGQEDFTGDRQLRLKVDKVNVPIGLVPQATERLRHSFRVYKYGWHFNPTNVSGPVWFGFDEIRQGLVRRDGTGFADVNPSGLPCTGSCSAGADATPEPPGDLRAGP
jgi:hypothetical protein